MRLSQMLGSSAGLSPVRVDSSYTAKPSELVLLDTTASGFSITLPNKGLETGSVVGLLDYSRTLDNHNVTVIGNGRLIEGQNSEVLSIKSVIVYYQYDAVNSSWTRRQVGTRDMVDIPKLVADMLNHKHDALYASLDHFHDDRYPPKNHTHDDRYIRLNGNSAPALTDTVDIGDADHRFKSIYAVDFVGRAMKARYTSASGADLAEKYTVHPDCNLAGTVLSRSEDPRYIADIYPGLTPRALILGPISDEPGVLINSEGEGVPVGRIGILEAWAYGPAPFGKMLVVRNGGCTLPCKGEDTPEYLYASSLDTSGREDTRLIKILV